MVRRKKYLIKKRFQMRFITFFSVFALIHIVISGGALYFLLNRAVKDAMYRSHITINNMSEIMWPEVLRVNGAAGLILLLFSIIIVFKLTGVINAQLTPLREHAKAVGEGDLTVRLSPALNDLTDDLSRHVNIMTQDLEKRFTMLKSSLSVIKEKQCRIEQAIGRKNSVTEIQKEWQELERAIEIFGKNLDGLVAEPHG